MKSIIGNNQQQLACPTIAPVGAVGMDTSNFSYEASRPGKWLVTVVVAGGPSDVSVWGAYPDNNGDDIWGLFQDEYAVFPKGKVATALANGTYYYTVWGLGLFAALYFQSSAGTVNVTVSEVLETLRGS